MFKGELDIEGAKRVFQVCLDINIEEKRKKINFYADGSRFTEKEKTEILLAFNEMLGRNVDNNTVEE